MSHRQNSVIGLSHPASTQPASMHQCSMTFGGKAHSIGPSHVHFLKGGQAPGSSGTPQLAACSAITRALFSSRVPKNGLFFHKVNYANAGQWPARSAPQWLEQTGSRA